MNQNQGKTPILIVGLILVGLCMFSGIVAVTAFATQLYDSGQLFAAVPTIPSIATSTPLPTFTPSPTPTIVPPTEIPTETPTPLPTETPTPLPTEPPTATPEPPTPTEVPTIAPRVAPPTATNPPPTEPPAPTFTFSIAETGQFPTSHKNFDVFIAVTDGGNAPISGYRVIAFHSDGMQVESELSANDWTHNSGAMHYKAGNIKFQALNSPSGTWTLQLVDGAGSLIAPPVPLGFDTGNPNWYFVLYRQGN